MHNTVASYWCLCHCGVVFVQEYTPSYWGLQTTMSAGTRKLQPTVISATGRIHLLLGDVAAAKECFAAAITDQSEEQLQSQLNRLV